MENVLILIVSAFFVIFTLILHTYLTWPSKDDDIPGLKGRSILWLFAHPDDECMFFGPSILNLSQNNDVMVLCLSNGNESGLGRIRTKELEASCNTLGIKETYVNIENHAALQDDPRIHWDPAIISDILKDYVTKNGIDTIITFDDKGISGHPNHISCYNGARVFAKNVSANDVLIYKLKTVNVFRKYISLFDLTWTHYNYHVADMKKKTNGVVKPSTPPDTVLLVSSFENYIKAREAMKCHKSQLVWFRYLYVLFSRYMVINELERVQ
ncbi:6369_t:CDS:2 [Paraglomus occultum]|uniref:N-acetylglucosaminylphosphatidylinositol deacetylase n=1 Tax=Paraglomus occultum TaxID=144539 RepID=A0A9N9AWR3_9GLOM|nr:6369_t:CDS:2 [Paraglomus occultum]